MGGRASLILVMGFGFIFGYLALSLNELETRTVDNAANYLEVTTSHNLAVAGENVALSILFQDSTLWNRTTDTVLMTETFTTGAFKNGDFTAYFKMVAGQPDQRLVRSASNYTSYGVTYHDTVETLFKRVTNWNILGLMIGFGGVGS